MCNVYFQNSGVKKHEDDSSRSVNPGYTTLIPVKYTELIYLVITMNSLIIVICLTTVCSLHSCVNVFQRLRMDLSRFMMFFKLSNYYYYYIII